MKTKQVCAASAWLFVLVVKCHWAAAQNTAFTYQGRLTTNGAPQAGSSDLTFTLYDAASGGNVIGGPLTNSAASDANGVFTVTLDFGSTPFEGQPRWLQIGVRPNGGGAFTTLTPRQPLTANPYALYAATPTVQGQPGVPGSVWREGSGAPANSTGIDGDYYLDGLTGNVYLRSSGSYAVVANIKGAQGQPGINGLNGQNGLPGAPGSLWREGSGLPANSTGIDGDYYLDGLTGNVYLRSSGTYAVVANIKGQQGQPGLVALPFSGAVATNIPAFKVTNSGGDAIDGFTGTGYALFGEATSSGGWGGLFRYGSDGNNSAYLGANGSAGSFYGPVTVNGSTSNVLCEVSNSGNGGSGVAVRGDAPLSGAYGELGVSTGTVEFAPTYGVYGNGGTNGEYAGYFDGTVVVAGGFGATTISSGTISGTAINGTSVQAGPASPNGATLSTVGTRTGSWNFPIAYIENQNTGANSSPALRVVSSGDSPNGALSVSQQGTGLIAQFGNANSFVSHLDSAGNWCGTTFTGCSDRNIKENFRDVNAREVLEKVAVLPITRWNYKADAGTQHLGPMAQDFYSAFRVGPDDKHIATVDADGVALAALQGLNQKVEEQRSALCAKDAEIRSLEQRLKKLETLVEQFTDK